MVIVGVVWNWLGNRVDAFEKVRVDEGERHGADALDFNHYVLIAADSSGVALVARECAGDDADAVALADVVLAVNLAAVGAVGGQEADEGDLGVGDRLDAGPGYVAVDAEGRKAVRRVVAPLLQGEGLGLGSLYEHEPGDYGAHGGASVAVPDCLLRKVDRTAQGAEATFSLEDPGRFYSIPMYGIVHLNYPVSIYDDSYRQPDLCFNFGYTD